MSLSVVKILVILMLFMAIAFNVLIGYRLEALRIPLLVYSGIYGLTIVLGSIFIGLYPDQAFNMLEQMYGISKSLILKENFLYWFLLFVPLFLPTFVAVFFCQFMRKKIIFNDTFKNESGKIFIYLYVAILIFLIPKLVDNFEKINSIQFQKFTSYDTFILIREKFQSSLSGIMFAFIYRSLPALSFIAYYRALTDKKIKWKLIFLFMFASICILSIIIAQKAPLMIYLLILIFGYFSIKKVNFLFLTLFVGSIIFIFMGYQFFLQPQKNFLDHFNLLFFRMASGYPFYLSIYPDIMLYGGLNFDSDFLGLGYKNNVTLTVFNYMYPNLPRGNQPIAAHVFSYSLGGVFYSLFILFLIGLMISFTAFLKKNLNNEIIYSLYLSMLMTLYYLTQTSFQDSMISSYGIIWGFFPIILLLILNKLLSKIKVLK